MRKRVWRAAPEVACFLLVVEVYLLYLTLPGNDRLYYDSYRYWERGELFGQNGGFSLLSFHDRYRGYSLPLFNHWLQEIASALGIAEATIIDFAGALSAAALGVVVLPRLARALFSEAAVSWSRVLALNALVFLFWRGHFGFPLTDVPALLSASVGLLALQRATPPAYLAAGLSFGLAANLRPAYVPVAIGALLVTAILPLRQWDWLRRGLAVILVVLGLVTVALPQMAINHRHYDTWSPTPVAAREIALYQLTYGLLAQKYETYVGSLDEYPKRGVVYGDPIASDVLADEGIEEISSYGEYLRIALRHPKLVASYLLHTYNGLDVRYATPYVRDLEDSPLALSLLLYTVLFAAIGRLVLPEARRQLGRVRWAWLALFVLPSLTAIPGAVEPRYFLPVTVLAYMLVCFGPGTIASFFGGSTVRRVSLAGLYISFLVLCFTLSAGTQAQIEYPIDRAAESAPVGSSPPFEDLERAGASDDDETLALE